MIDGKDDQSGKLGLIIVPMFSMYDVWFMISLTCRSHPPGAHYTRTRWTDLWRADVEKDCAEAGVDNWDHVKEDGERTIAEENAPVTTTDPPPPQWCSSKQTSSSTVECRFAVPDQHPTIWLLSQLMLPSISQDLLWDQAPAPASRAAQMWPSPRHLLQDQHPTFRAAWVHSSESH